LGRAGLRVSARNEIDLDGQQQVVRATFPGIRNAVRELICVQMDKLAIKFHETKDLTAHDEIYRLSRELIKLS
jgi:hypothetical protein